MVEPKAKNLEYINVYVYEILRFALNDKWKFRTSLRGCGSKARHQSCCNNPDDTLPLPRISQPDEESYSLHVPWNGVMRLLFRQSPFVLHSNRRFRCGIEGRCPDLHRRFVRGHEFRRILCRVLHN